MADSPWASDVPVSMPQPLAPDNAPLVDMGGFVFTINGLFHNLTTTDHEQIGTPTYAPYDPQTIIYDDAAADTDSVEFL